MRFTVSLVREDDAYVAQCLEIDVASQGESEQEALANLREALELYFDDTDPVDVEPATIAHLDFAVG